MAEIYLFCSDEQFQPEEIVNQAVTAEAVGFDGVMISEHFHPWVDDHSASGFAFSTLGAIAVKTTHINLMTAVTAPLFRFHPAVIAQAAATIDRLSNGRFTLGIGTGENINEGPLGFVLPPYKERAARLAEAHEIIQRLLAGEKLNFHGNYYQTSAAKLYSPPKHTVSILLAAGGPQSATTAGKHYDGIIVSAKNIEHAKQNVILPAKAVANNNYTVVANRWSILAQNDTEAWQALQSQRGLRAPSRAEAIDPIQLQTEADKLPRGEILNLFSRVQNAADYITTYAPLIAELGADIVGIQTTSIDQLATIEMLGKEVVPVLHKL